MPKGSVIVGLKAMQGIQNVNRLPPPASAPSTLCTSRLFVSFFRFCLAITLYPDTGNSCTHPGYREFQGPDVWPSECAPTKGDLIPTETETCGEGEAYPEEFWNCADISITAGEIEDGKIQQPKYRRGYYSMILAVQPILCRR